MTALSFIRSDTGTLAILTTSSDNQGASSEIFVGPKRKLVGEKNHLNLITYSVSTGSCLVMPEVCLGWN